MSSNTEGTRPPLKSSSSSTLPVADGENPTENGVKNPQKSTDDANTSVTANSEGGAEQEAGKPEEEHNAQDKGKAKGDPAEKPGLLVTPELLRVIEECKTKVETIAKECRAKNTKYRDLEFDMLNEAHMCLYSVRWSGIHKLPSDKQRVTEVFESPTFFKSDDGNPSSDDIHQGALGDCWFLCALATISNLPHLVQQVCVARDEDVGVYGFIFYRDDGWISVIIDDLLFTNAPKWEELTQEEKTLYHDKDQFNTISRKGGKILTFAKSGAHGETWVPLIEKAYAKFYGCYNHLQGGFPREAIEDLTGGVATLFLTTDILDRDAFWKDQLSKANQDRLFSCYFHGLNNPDVENVRVQGLVGSHAYSVLRTVECNGKRFVVVRNPWGTSEWTGRWADGSKEWKGEWLKVLPQLGHTFGDDGQFVMEYEDFLTCFTHMDRTLLFDSGWTATSKWLQVPLQEGPIPWSYGDLSYVVAVPSATRAVFVLSQLNSRFFEALEKDYRFNLDFSIVKEGESKPFTRSSQAMPFCRRVTVEADLEPGRYFVYVRIDRSEFLFKSPWEDNSEFADKMYNQPALAPYTLFDSRQLSHALDLKAKSYKVANNYRVRASKFEPTTLESVIAKDEANKKKLGLRRALSRMFTSRTKCEVDPNDFYEGLLSKNPAIVLGLNVYTKKDVSATVMGRLRDGIPQ